MSTARAHPRPLHDAAMGVSCGPLRPDELPALREIDASFVEFVAAQPSALASGAASTDVLRVSAQGMEQIVAYIHYWVVDDEAQVLDVVTAPAARRHGYAARLLGHVIDLARGRGLRQVTLEVRRSNYAALRLYRKHRFRPVGLRPRYYADNDEDAVVMARELDDTTPASD